MHDSQEPASRPALRASDAERDRVEETLKHHYAAGRLDLAELETRVTATHTARTRDQLAALVRDLPPEPEPVPESPAPGPGPAPAIDSRLLVVLLCVSPPAALVYWLLSRRSAARRPAADDGAVPY